MPGLVLVVTELRALADSLPEATGAIGTKCTFQTSERRPSIPPVLLSAAMPVLDRVDVEFDVVEHIVDGRVRRVWRFEGQLVTSEWIETNRAKLAELLKASSAALALEVLGRHESLVSVVAYFGEGRVRSE